MSSHYRHWGQSFLRGSLGAILLCCAAVAGAQSSSQDAPELLGQSFDFDVPAQKVSTAILAIAKQAQIQALMAGNVLDAYQAEGLNERLSLAEALDRVLSGTPYAYQQTGRNAIMVGTPEALQEQGSVAGQNTIGQRRPGIEEIIVTGQKREERIQDVPIAISAFSPEDLEAQKIEGGFDLLKGVPNVTFSKTNFSGYNFQIRGIGTQAVSATTDPGVAVSFNNTTLIVNRLFEQEYLDVERVEVLRGPQGTLFGRNATSGVINVITNKPEMGVWDGMIDIEVGNFNTRRLRGFFNAPIGDEWAIRGAYASTVRDGYGINLAADDPFADVSRDVDDRDLWTGRLSLGWQPTDRFRANLIWERFEEDDERVRTSKQLCHRDENPEQLLGGLVNADNSQTFRTPNPIIAAQLTQGCEPGSLYEDAAFGTVNGPSVPYVSGIFFSQAFGPLMGFVGFPPDGEWAAGPNPYWPGFEMFGGDGPDAAPCESATLDTVTFTLDICNPDPYRGRMQSRDLRTISSAIAPEYRASADIFELSFDWEITDHLLLSSQTVYADDEYYATQDYNRYASFPVFQDVSHACGTFPFFGLTFPDCSDDPNTGRGTHLPLVDEDFDGIVDQTGEPVGDGRTVDGAGFVRDADGRRVGFYTDLMAGGVYCDPQLGCSDKLILQDLSRSKSSQYNQELRLVSSYPGDWNFSLGANFTRFRTLTDYFVFSNAFSHLLHFPPFNPPQPAAGAFCPVGPGDGILCRYVDPNPLEDIDGEGHNYFRSANPYKLTSSALFGELYWNATDTVKVTLGLRMSWDRKEFTPRPSQLLLADYRDLGAVSPGDPPPEPDDCTGPLGPNCTLTGNAVGGRGAPSLPDIVQEWSEPTGRLVVDWSPVLDWTDETMAYASFAHGYKGGGANPPGVAPPSGLILSQASGGTAPKTFEPEFINAYELGTKNTLFGGALVLNGTVFYYDYSDYQVSKIVDRTAINENFDAEVWGAELEMVFAPSLDWQFNAAIGYLNTEIAEGEKSVDLMDRALGGDTSFTTPDGVTWDGYTVIKPWVSAASNCIVPTNVLAAAIHDDVNNNVASYCPAGDLVGSVRRGGETAYFDEEGNLVRPFDPEHDGRTYNPLTDAPNNSAGFFKDLSGNELPNAPHFTVALGGQYNFDLTRDWRATARVDYYWQDESYARVYNFEPYDRLKSWSNTNLSFWATHAEWGVTVEGYVKNVFDETPITGTFLNSDDSGLTTNVFTLDPRLIGVSIRKEF